MTSQEIRYYTGEDWEARIHGLLHCHYSPGEYVKVPDRDGGDAGIDGFSRDGVVYQCYAPQEPLPVEKLYEACRDKMTTDVGKFVRNSSRVAAILGPTIAKSWLLVVPRIESTRLLEHANTKTAEMRKAHQNGRLRYVGPDFTVGVITDAAFRMEEQMLALAAEPSNHLQLPRVRPRDRGEWTQEVGVPVLLEHVRRKVATVGARNPDALEREMVDAYLLGTAFLGMLERDYPALHQEILSRKSKREVTLGAEAALADAPCTSYLRELRSAIEKELSQAIRGLTPGDAVLVAQEFIADWMLRCPLDFA